MAAKRIVVVTGVSGSGKTSAIKALEDLGYFCVDNLPQELFTKFLELGEQKDVDIALGIDIRSQILGGDFSNFLQKAKGRVEVLFLEARTEILVRRFSETRRKHPVPLVKSVEEGLEKELQWVKTFREQATDIIDTSSLNVHDLRKLIYKKYGRAPDKERLRVNLISFGFRFGIPLDADMVIDTRCLPNPHYEEKLRDSTGLDQPVIEFLEKDERVKQFVESHFALFESLTPLYEKEDKAYLTIAIGCTGGHHRSVYMAKKFEEFFKKRTFEIHVNHRDIHR